VFFAGELDPHLCSECIEHTTVEAFLEQCD